MKTFFIILIIPFLLTQCITDNNRSEALVPIEQKNKNISNKFEINTNQLSYVIAITESGKLAETKKYIKGFNLNSGYEKLRMNNIYLGTGEDKLSIVAIRRFENIESAQNYCKIYKGKANYKPISYILPISQNNYRRLLKNKNFEKYRMFYKKYIAL
ncbi:MAG TPA: hypothetical protein ENJ95_14910 [Bacteroidetes bacterium]|nr:hypothetical protein [Bacteroidota bacterium]